MGTTETTETTETTAKTAKTATTATTATTILKMESSREQSMKLQIKKKVNNDASLNPRTVGLISISTSSNVLSPEESMLVNDVIENMESLDLLKKEYINILKSHTND